MAELIFFAGTMDCGKSTLALQLDYTHRERGRAGLVLTKFDRAGQAVVSSRLGLVREALEVTDDLDIYRYVVDTATSGQRIDFVIADEAQFYSAAQIEQLARLVDELDCDVFAFGITADFRTYLFEGSKRLIELADRVHTLQVEALCWCGRRATHNARLVGGVMVVEGEQVVVGDVASDVTAAPKAASSEDAVDYEVLCRRHYMRRMTSHSVKAATLSPDVLPFGGADA